MDKLNTIAIIGGGSWATALAKILSDNSNHAVTSGNTPFHNSLQIRWWMRNNESIEFINQYKHNPNYLSSVQLNLDVIKLQSNLPETISYSDVVIMAVPAAFLSQTLSENRLEPSHFRDKVVVSAIKGIIPKDNLIIGDFFYKKYNVPYNSFVVISGPCHAEEVAMEKLSYLTVSSQNEQKAILIANLLKCHYIKTITSDDIFGTEYSAVLKNIVAIASGVCHGIGYGDNFQAVLISNAIQEIKRFVDAVHPIERDIKDSAYLGDLLVTAYSQFSRNRTLGSMIGKGYSAKSAMIEMGMIAEGYYASACIHEINKKHNVQMPICDAIYNILHEKITPRVEMRLLSEKLR